MLTLHNIPWGEFKHFVMLVQRHNDLNDLLGECYDYIIDDNTREIWAYNDTIIAPPNRIPCIVWNNDDLDNLKCIVWNNDDLDNLKWWRDKFDELGRMYKTFPDIYRFNLLQYICDEIESLITERNVDISQNELKCSVCGSTTRVQHNHVDYGVDICMDCHNYIADNMTLIGNKNVNWDVFAHTLLHIDVESGDDNLYTVHDKMFQHDKNIMGYMAVKWGNDIFVHNYIIEFARDILNQLDGFGYLTLEHIGVLTIIKNTK